MEQGNARHRGEPLPDRSVKDTSVQGSPLRLLTILGVVILIGFMLVLSGQYVFTKLHADLDAKLENERARLAIGEEIIHGLDRIKSQSFQLATLDSRAAIRLVEGRIHDSIGELEHLLGVIENGGSVTIINRLNLEDRQTLERVVDYHPPEKKSEYALAIVEMRPKLDRLSTEIASLSALLKARLSIPTTDPAHHNQDVAVSNFLKRLTAWFRRMEEDGGRIFYRSQQGVEEIRAQLGEDRRFYLILQSSLATVIVILVLGLMIIIGRQILADRQRIVVAIREAEQAREAAMKASEAKSELLANMSHELRTPLNAVIGYSEMMDLKMLGELSKPYQEYAQLIHTSGHHLLGIINQILDLAKIEAGKVELEEEEVFMGDLVNQVIALLDVKAKAKDIGLINRTKRMHTMRVDPVRIRQALFNVIGNAIKFTDRGEVVISNRCDCVGHRIIVKDTGVGMSEADLEVALQEFGQVGGGDAYVRTTEGTGLGLNLTKHLMEIHEGELQITSEVGKGTEVILFFPSHRGTEPVEDDEHEHGQEQASETPVLRNRAMS